MLKALKASENDLTVRLAVFFHDIAKPICFTCDQNRIRHYKNHAELGAKLAEDILKRLKYSSKTIKNVSALIKYHDTDIAPEKPEVKKYLNLLGKELLKKLFSVKTADCLAKPGASEKWYADTISARRLMEKIIKENECCCLKELELKGDDLLKAGIKEKNIGKVLNEVLNEVIYERLENKKSVLLKYALSYAEKITF